MSLFEMIMFWIGVLAIFNMVTIISWLVWMFWSLDKPLRKSKKRRCKNCKWRGRRKEYKDHQPYYCAKFRMPCGGYCVENKFKGYNRKWYKPFAAK